MQTYLHPFMANKLLARVCLTLLLILPFSLAADNLPDNHKVFGRAETVLVTDQNIQMGVRLDTGAQTSSLTATDIQIFKKNGKDWVKFTVKTNRMAEPHYFELPVLRHIRIRKRKAEVQGSTDLWERRVSVSVPVCLATERKMIEVSLADRSQFEYPMLLGRSGMETFGILIDPSKTFTVKPHCSEPVKQESVS